MSLHIDLTEPVVFLRRSSDISASGRRRQVATEAPPSILRGVLTLKLNKPTKIKNVEVFLESSVTTEWPEGIGPRRSEITEENPIVSANATLFKAGNHSPDLSYRRAQSLGPAMTSGFDSDSDDEDSRGRSRLPAADPNGSRDTSRSRSPNRNMIRNRGVSMDPFGRHRYPMTDLPAYSVPSPLYTPEASLHDLPEEYAGHPGQTLEELRNILRANTDHFVQEPGRASGRSSSALRSAASSRPVTASRSRAPSIHRQSILAELSPTPSRLTPSADDHSPNRTIDDSLTLSPTVTRQRRPSFSRNVAGGSSSSVRRTSATPDHQLPPLSPTASRLDERPSRQKRFSFGAAWQEMKDRVKPTSRRTSTATTERPLSPKPARSSSRPTSTVRASLGMTATERKGDVSRGREGSRGRDRTVVGKLSGALGLEDERKDLDWEEFRKGTYNWPISFQIPVECPPSIRCDYGSVVYRIRAHVTRVGTFASKLTASTEVTIIACPGEDDTEETESIIVEREWDNNLRYVIALSGKSFPIGGVIPIHLTLMPMSKMGVYRVSVLLEEKVDYFAHGGKVVRHDTPRGHQLLTLKSSDKYHALLPIFSESPDAATRNPLAPYVDVDDPSEAAGHLLSPVGPWALRFLVKVPDCTTKIHFTNKYSKARITVSHTLKIVLRVDKGEESELDSRGKRKQFDIIVESPIQLLSCRCNPEWMSLPTYSLFPLEASSNSYGCICNSRQNLRAAPTANDFNILMDMDYPSPLMGASSGSRRQQSPQVTDEHAHHVLPRGADTLDDRNRQYASLVSGSEREDGERPPTYEAATVH